MASKMETLEATSQSLWRRPVKGEIFSLPDGEIACCDGFELLDALCDESADLIFLDPPFNLGKKYGERSKADDRRDRAEYQQFITNILLRSCEVLRPGGALYLYHIPFWAVQFAPLLSQQLTFRHWIAISMKNGFVRGRNLYPAHYALLYFTKGEPANFTRPKIPAARCRHCGDYVKDYGGYERHIRNGVNLSDIWDDLSPVRHHKYKNRKANELPFELPRRVVEISGSAGGLFVDPFAGAGTSLLAATQARMRIVASDHERSNCDLMTGRLGFIAPAG